MHYQRWRHHGDPLYEPPIRVKLVPPRPPEKPHHPPEDLWERWSDQAKSWWFVGFVEGEGCFYGGVSQAGILQVSFTVCQRWDNPLPLEIAQELLPYGKAYRRDYGYRKPIRSWTVNECVGLAAVVGFFDRYPLRSKKAEDYALWRELVTIKLESRPGKRWTRERERVLTLAEQLKSVRVFREESEKHEYC